jgi:hypothetical protein
MGAKDIDVIEKILHIAERELTLEEYARFLTVIAQRAGDSVKELREFRDKATHEEILARLKKRGAKIMH